MKEALVNPRLIQWARERAWLEPEVLAEKVNVKLEKLLAWEDGKARPTFRQAQQLAKATRIPFGFLYLPEPPKETLPIPDLRTVANRELNVVSVDLRDVINDAIRKQDWYRDFLREQGAHPLDFVGKYDLKSDAKTVAADITRTLGLEPEDRKGNYESFLTTLIDRAETCGIMVLRNGVVGHNTRRPLNVEEFRGFAIADKLAPLVFVNNRDAKAGQIFTLVHELAHLWLGESGISDLTLRVAKETHQRVERLCNAIAAEVLVPENEISALWQAEFSLDEKAGELAARFKVSTVVVGFRLQDLGFLSWKEAAEFYNREKALWSQSGGTGGQFYSTAPVRNSKLFTAAVLRQALGHQMLLRDAGRLLGMKPASLKVQAEKMKLEL